MDLTNPSNGDTQLPNVINQPEQQPDGEIYWANYNYPPCIPIVHFSLIELKGKLRSFVAYLWLSYIILLAILIINSMIWLFNVVFSTIIQVAKYGSAIKIFYTFLSK